MKYCLIAGDEVLPIAGDEVLPYSGGRSTAL